MSPEEQGLFHNNLGSSPLAERLRPRSLHEMLLPPGLDSQLFEQWRSKVPSPPSLILWGPPGSGKTTLARALGAACKARFHEMSAVAAGVKDVRTIIQQAQNSLTPTLLFLDEVHRFNAAQQDVLLPWIERGTLSFIGATTENPTFSLNAALLSRCQVIHLTGFGEESLIPLLRRACEEENISVSPQEEALLLRAAQGDARALLRTIEEYTRAKEHFSSVEAYLQQTPHILYDRSGDQHFDTVSAFIKSMRAGDLDSALYFGFRMIKAGEDPRYLLRRMIIFASEDIGNAEPQALVVANQAAEAYERVGLPEGKIPISQAICFLTEAPKSRRCYNALRAAEKFIEANPNIPVPLHLRNKKPLGMGKREEQELSTEAQQIHFFDDFIE